MILIHKSDVLLSHCNRINTRNIHLNLVSSSNETKFYRKFPMQSRTAHAVSTMCALLSIVVSLCCLSVV